MTVPRTNDLVQIGFGVFGWNSTERITGRYGALCLTSWTCDSDRPVNVAWLRGTGPFVGKRVRLLARVVHARDSRWHMTLAKSRVPKAGDVVELGVGTFRVEKQNGCRAVILKPDLARRENWIDPDIFRALADQTVALFAEETGAECAPAVTQEELDARYEQAFGGAVPEVHIEERKR